jgi:large subunit ribosomal protein L3
MSETNTNTEKAAVSLGHIYASKAGMTRVFTEEGEAIAVTVLNLRDDSVITQVKTKDKDGYDSVQIGFRVKKQQRVNKAEAGHFKKVSAPGFYHVEEIRLEKAVEGAALGTVLSADFLTEGSFVDIKGITKGKGFQGSMKRWNFGGMPQSHGHSVSHRSPGSIGNRADPGRVFPGKKMATHFGTDTQTTQNLKVVAYDAEKKLLLVRVAVPGFDNAVVRVAISKKKGNKKPAAKAKA